MVNPKLFNGFPKFFLNQEKYLLGLARRMTRHDEMAQDAVSAAKVKFLEYGYWESKPRDSWLALLTTIVKTCAADEQRHALRVTTSTDFAGSSKGDDEGAAVLDPNLNIEADWHRGLRECVDPVESIHRHRVSRALLSALSCLSPRQFTVLVEQHLFDSKRHEVAALLNIKPETVKTHLKAGVSRLRRQPALRSLMDGFSA